MPTMSAARCCGSMAAPSGPSIESASGCIWSRPGLDRKQRSLVALGILIALRRTEEFKNHVQIGLRNGLTVAEIEEALIQATAYAGFPAAHAASNAAAAVVAQLCFCFRSWPFAYDRAQPIRRIRGRHSVEA
jgi:4-carboxymuconolactone decarboxylase